MGKPAPRHWYPTLMIIICIRLILEAVISFRAVPKAIHIAFSDFDAVKNQPIPSNKTVGRWLCLLGLYKLNCPKEQADDWALIVDNSIQLGTKKCLVILGMRLSKFRGKSLTFEDMEILAIELHEHSTKEIVCQALEKAQRKIGKAAMVCADDGSDIRGGIELFCEKYSAGRVFDTIHKIGVFLKRAFENNEEWKSFSSKAAEAKRKMQQTPAAHLAPPNQRTKSRFLNIECLVGWGSDIIKALENPGHPDKELLKHHCGWVKKHKELIRLLEEFWIISQKVRKHIREQGLRSNTGKQVENLLEPLRLSMEGCQYAGELIDFFYAQAKVVPDGQIWIGSSEIIESLFGKVKHLEQDQSKGGFTSLILGAAACVGKIDADTVSRALDQYTMKDIEFWTSQQIGTTLVSQRRKSFGGRRKKKIHLKNFQESTGFLEGNVVGF